MLASVSVVDITPPMGIELGGGAFGPATGVLHPLSAKAVMLAGGDERIIVVSCDLLGFDAELASRIRRRISRAADVAYDAVLLACTHTHCAPAAVTLRQWGTPDPAYCTALADKLVDAARSAAEELGPARVGCGAVQCEGIAVNRALGEAGGTCDTLTAIRIDGDDGRAMAVLVNYACHPVNLHSSGRVTPDFPHYLEHAVRKRMATDAPVLFLTGACGDLLPANFEKRPSDPAARQTGRAIAERAVEALAAIETRPDAPLAFAAGEVSVGLQPLPSRAELERVIAERTEELAHEEASPTNWAYCGHMAAIAWATEAIEAIERSRERESTTVALQAIRIGNAGLVAMPSELFAEFGREIAACDALPHTFMVTLANGCMGYFPSRAAYERETYEAVHCPRFVGLQLFEPDVGERVCEAAIEMLGRLGRLERNPQSRRLWGRSCNVIVGGGQAHKRPVEYMYAGGPAFAVRAKGSRFWDADGNEYIDYLLGYGPIVIGHADDEVNDAVRQQMAHGTIYSIEHPLSIELAERLCGLIPSAEMVLYSVGGSAATLGAVRCARAHTGRERIVRCGYHGWYDAFTPVARGVPAATRELVADVPYDDLDALANRLEEHPGKIAGVIVEAVQGDGPGDGYFTGVRQLCDEHGAAFILDEVKTGFRFGLGGAQELLGIEPDLSCFGKAMCNGYPASVVVGRRDVLEAREDVFLAATFHADALSLAAAMKVIDIMEQRNGIGLLRRLGGRLIDGVNDAFAATDLPCRMVGHPAMPAPVETTVDDPDRPIDPAWRGRALSAWCAALQRRGVYGTGHPWFLSLAHTDDDIARTIAVAEAAAEEARRELEA